MTHNETNEINSLMREFDAIQDYLEVMHGTIQKGQMPNLAGLDDRITSLCITVQESSPPVQKQCRTRLNELLNQLDRCEEEMTLLQKSLRPSEKK